MGAVQIGIIKAQKFAFGGLVRGPGGPKDDQVPAMLSNGEYVVRAAATERYKPILDAINYGRSVSVQPKLAYAAGGMVSRSGDMRKDLAEIANKIDILNMNLVKKNMAPIINISGSAKDTIRVQDKSRSRMEDLGYEPSPA